MTALIVVLFVIAFVLLCFYNKKIKDKIVNSPVEQTELIKDNELIKHNELIKIINNNRFMLESSQLKVSSLFSEIGEEKAKYKANTNEISDNYFTTYEENAIAIRFEGLFAKNYSTPTSFFRAYLKNKTYKQNIENKNFNWVGSATVNNFNCIFFATY